MRDERFGVTDNDIEPRAALLQSVIDLQDCIYKTGTLEGTEFGKRTEYTGPAPNVDLPPNVVTAPGDYTKSQRVSLN